MLISGVTFSLLFLSTGFYLASSHSPSVSYNFTSPLDGTGCSLFGYELVHACVCILDQGSSRLSAIHFFFPGSLLISMKAGNFSKILEKGR